MDSTSSLPSSSSSTTVDGDDASSVYSLDSTCRPQRHLEVEEFADPSWCSSPSSLGSSSCIDETIPRRNQKRPSWLNFFLFKTKQHPELNNTGSELIFKYSRRPSNGNESIDDENASFVQRIVSPPRLRVFTSSELNTATRNFKFLLLGVGGVGRVFQGWVDEKTLSPSKSRNGMIVAVKGCLHLEEMQREIELFGQLSHPNFVKLLGYCQLKKESYLVHEYMSRGSFYSHLFAKGTANKPMSWDFRLKTFIIVAGCIAYLHSLDTPIIYCNLNTTSILLDSNYDIKLRTCGFARHATINGSNSYEDTRIVSTFGYIDPAWHERGQLSVNFNVYGFGVILLEMLSGQKSIDRTRPEEQKQLVAWLKPYLPVRENLSYFMDPRLEGQYPPEAAYQTAQLVLKCLLFDPTMRPSMKEVLETLEEIEALRE